MHTRRILCLLVIITFLLSAMSYLSRIAAAAAPELVLQCGHVAQITAALYSPDGALIATGSRDGMVKIWDASDGSLRDTLPASHGAVLAIAFSHDSKSLYVAADDGRVSQWNIHNGVRLSLLEPPGAAITAASVLEHNGDLYYAAAMPDFSLKLWEVKSGKTDPVLLGTLKGHKSVVHALAFSNDAALLASGSDDGLLDLWDVGEDADLNRSIKSHAMPQRSIAFSPDGTMVADASDDGEANVWDTKTGKQLKMFHMNAPGDGILSVAWSSDGKRIVTAGTGYTNKREENLQIWDVASESVLHTLIGHPRLVTAAAFSPNGKSLVSGSVDFTARIWRTDTGTAVASLGVQTGIPAILYAANGSQIIAGGKDGNIRIWSSVSGELLRVLKGHKGSVRALAIIPKSAVNASPVLVSGSLDGAVKTWNLDKGVLLKTTDCASPVNSVAVSHDTALIAAGCGSDPYDGSVKLIDAKTGSITLNLDKESLAVVQSVAFSNDDSMFVTGSGYGSYGEVRFWDTKTHEQLSKKYMGNTHFVVFTPNGKTLIAGSDESDPDKQPVASISLWNPKSFSKKSAIVTPEGDGWINAAAAGPDSHSIITVSDSGVVHQWNATSGEDVRAYGRHFGPALSVAGSPDGTSYATAGDDDTIKIWDSATGHLRATLYSFENVKNADPLDWLAMTPEGYYDASPGSSRYIRWQAGAVPFPIDAFDQLLHQPGELAKSLAGETVAALPETLDTIGGDNAPPVVAFVAPHDGDAVDKDNVTVQVVASARKEISSFYLLVDGRSMSNDGKPLVLGAKPLVLGAKPLAIGAKPLSMGAKPLSMGAKPLAIGAKPLAIGAKPLTMGAKPIADGVLAPESHTVKGEVTATVAFPAGQDSLTLSAVAYDKDGLQARQSIRIARDAVNTETGSLYVLAVGVSKYANPHFNLKYASSDAASFAGLWASKAKGLYKNIVPVCLTDENATVGGVRSAFFKLIEQAKEADTVVIFLSGHGLQLPGSRYYFATHEIDPATEEKVAETALPWTTLETALAGLHARRVLLFLDACHSGSTLGEKQAHDERLAGILASRAGVIVLASSRGSEYSYEADELQHGAFTAAIIEGLSEGKANFEIGGKRQNQITVEGLLAYLRVRVPQLTENRQTPTCPLLHDFGDPFPLVTAQ